MAANIFIKRFNRQTLLNALGIAAILLSLYLFSGSFCPIASLIKLPCPGCGLGRATLAVLHGDIHEAHRFHALVIPAWLLGLYATFQHIRQLDETRLSAAIFNLATTLFIAYWLCRFLGYFGGPVPLVEGGMP